MVRVSVGADDANRKFLAGYPRFDGLPYLYVLDAKGKLLQAQSSGALEKGKSYDHAEMMGFLDRVRPPL
ncbi:MAG: hypothetical protein OEZ06_00960 [Myxococcales bacterium]|nr:hypothetical protein [Myxococcales bacterium]